MKPPKDTITLPLDEYLADLLGENHSVPIRANVAEILDIKLKGKCTYHIQWPDAYNPDLRKPLLWSYAAWVESVELWERQRKRSHDERVARFMFEENVRILARHLVWKYCMTEDRAPLCALSIMKCATKDLKVSQCGIKKLITSEDEL
jgi:hypothetical protein